MLFECNNRRCSCIFVNYPPPKKKNSLRTVIYKYQQSRSCCTCLMSYLSIASTAGSHDFHKLTNKLICTTYVSQADKSAIFGNDCGVGYLSSFQSLKFGFFSDVSGLWFGHPKGKNKIVYVVYLCFTFVGGSWI